MVDDNDFIRLEHALIDAGRSIDYPATPNIAAHVHAVLQADRSRPPLRSIFRSRGLAIGLAVIVFVIALLIVIPETREAIAQFLGLRTIHVIEVTPTPTIATPHPRQRRHPVSYRSGNVVRRRWLKRSARPSSRYFCRRLNCRRKCSSRIRSLARAAMRSR